MIPLCYKWGKCNVKWNVADWKWSECQLIAEIISGFPPGIPGEESIPYWIKHPTSELDKTKRKRFIELMIKVNKKEHLEKKEIREDVKITIDDVKLVVKVVSGIDVNIL